MAIDLPPRFGGNLFRFCDEIMRGRRAALPKKKIERKKCETFPQRGRRGGAVESSACLQLNS